MNIRRFVATSLLALSSLTCSVSNVHANTIPGPQYAVRYLATNTNETFRFLLQGGSQSNIWVRGNGYSFLDIYIYDSFGRLILTGSVVPGTDRHFWFTPTATSTFSVQVVNRGYDTQYSLSTN
ncbi:MAG TPA: hypothetical protein VH437_19545 [Terriglobales bacterium]|jgi:hypothetical protein